MIKQRFIKDKYKKIISYGQHLLKNVSSNQNEVAIFYQQNDFSKNDGAES